MQTNANFSAALTMFNLAVKQHAMSQAAWSMGNDASQGCAHISDLVDVPYDTVRLACTECALVYLDKQRHDVARSTFGVCPALQNVNAPTDTIGHLFRRYLLDGRNTSWSKWFERNRAAIATAYSGVAGDEHADAAWLDAIGRTLACR
jgi:hypothetical protein